MLTSDQISNQIFALERKAIAMSQVGDKKVYALINKIKNLKKLLRKTLDNEHLAR